MTRWQVVRTQALLAAKLVTPVSKANRFSSSQPSCKDSNGVSVAFPSKSIAVDDLKAEALKLRERVRSVCALKAISKNEE